MEKYWVKPPEPGKQDLVVIHVCDEARQVNRDFCCKRDILVRHMKYFEKFLAENSNGYEDIDISVHCDVEIFEWLMVYIHEPGAATQIDKSIVVSILISSEFLQMESLVDVCVERISQSLGDIIKLPIDLSCISEKLVNKIAAIVSPKILSQTKDRKDKILNKLYKRRVELDFSRKSTGRNGIKTIATSLTCCKYCGGVYLDQYQAELVCPDAPPAIDFRGRISRRHFSTPGWSLTSYLKSLHIGGMGWDSIYWHVWAACIVLKVKDHHFSALEIDRYSIEIDGIIVHNTAFVKRKEEDLQQQHLGMGAAQDKKAFAIGLDLSIDMSPSRETYKILVSPFEELDPSYSHITSTLIPTRNPDILTSELLELLTTQMKFIAALSHRKLLESTAKSMLAALPRETISNAHWGVDYESLLWTDATAGEDGGKRRGRSLSPLNRGGGHGVAGGAKTAGAKSRPEESNESAARGRSRGVALSKSVPPRERKGATVTSGGAKEGADKKDGTGEETPIDGAETPAAVDAPAPEPVDLAQVESDARKESLLKSMPSDVFRQLLADKGGMSNHGIVLSSNPLQLLPPEMYEAMSTVGESTLTDAKKLEWNLDIIREYDEKRLDRCESYLVSQRNASYEIQLEYVNKPLKQLHNAKKKSGLGENGSATRMQGDYYKDKGRYPSRPTL